MDNNLISGSSNSGIKRNYIQSNLHMQMIDNNKQGYGQRLMKLNEIHPNYYNNKHLL